MWNEGSTGGSAMTWEGTRPTNALNVFVVCGGVMYMSMMGAAYATDPALSATLTFAGGTAVVVGFGQFFLRGYERSVEVSLDGRELSFRGAALPSVSLDEATLTLERWMTPGLHTHFGTILSVATPARTLTIGGAHHALGARVPDSDLQKPDLYLDAEDFDSLLAAIDPVRSLPRAAAGAFDEPQSIALMPNPTRGRSLFASLAPWLLTMLCVVGLNAVASLTDLAPTPEASRLIGIASMCVLVAGIALTIVLARRTPRSTQELVISQGSVELCSSVTGDSYTADLGALRVELGTHTLSARREVTPLPVLVIDGLGPKILSIGVLDPRYLWPGEPPDGPAPEFILGSADWSLLVGALGLPGSGG